MLIGDANVCNAEVEATLDGPAGVGFSDRREVLMPIHRDAHAGSAAHTRPLDAGREHLWSRVHRLHRTGGVREADGLELGYLPHEVELRTAKGRRRVANHVRRATPERMADATLTDDRIALVRACCRNCNTAWRDKVRGARLVCRRGWVRRCAGRFTTADQRSHRTEHGYLTDGPERIHIRPRCGPLANEHVTEAALNAGRGVPRCYGHCLRCLTLERCVLLDLEPRRQTAAQTFPAPHTEVRRRSLHVDLGYRGNRDRLQAGRHDRCATRGRWSAEAARREAVAVFREAERRIHGSIHFNAGLRERKAGPGQRACNCHG